MGKNSKKNILLGMIVLSIFVLILILISNIVSAQNYFSFPEATALRELEQKYAPIFNFLSIFFRINSEFLTEAPIMAFLCVILWVFLSISFSGIIQDFTLFSTFVSKLIGFVMTTIMAITGVIFGMIGFFYSLFGQLAAIVFVVLVISGSFLVEKFFDLNIKKKKVAEKKLKRKAGEKIFESVGGEVLDDRRKVDQNSNDTSTWD